MSYQNINYLIKRKERFGLIWLAAHCPRKLTKHDILQIDLTKKCKDLSEYVGKKSNKVKLSLLISAHLMKGLVIILQKKNVYLYDELVNLKLQLSKSYTLNEPVSKKRKIKAVKSVDEELITLKDNLPDFISETIVLSELDKTTSRYKSITLQESDDFSGMIPVEYDYTMDSFGAGPTDAPFLMPEIDDYTLAVEGGLVNNRPATESTGRKPEEVQRVPFGEITNIETFRPEQYVSDVNNNQTDIAQHSDKTGIDIPHVVDTDGIMPALFEATVLDQAPEPHAPTNIYDNDPQIDDITQLPVSGMIRTYSADISALKETHMRKQKLLLTKKRKNMIIDTVTEITVSISEKAKRLNKVYPKGTREHTEQYSDLLEMFREKSSWLRTRNDFQCLDLLSHPVSRVAARTDRVIHRNQLGMSINVRSLNEYGCMSTGATDDGGQVYHVDARGKSSAVRRRPVNVPEINEPQMNVTDSMAEEQRKENETLARQRLSFADKSKGLSMNKRESILEKNQKQDGSIFPQSDQKVDEPLPLPMEPIEAMQPLESFVNPPPEQSEMTNIVNNLMEINNFETLIIQCLEDRQDGFILQEFIQESEIPESCKRMQMPRKFFAAKMFSAVLSLVRSREICVKQDMAFGSIHVTNV